MAGSSNKLRALIVDDNPSIRKFERTLLEKQGFEVEEVENGQDAVNSFVDGNSFDLVLMDKDMPRMDGPTATRVLKEMGASCMIVGITADDDEGGTKAFVEAGLHFCLKKPLVNEGVARIKEELRHHLC